MTNTPTKTPKKDPRANLRRWWFEKEQPSPQAKSAGRDRKRQAQKIMALVLEYQNMTTGELKTYMEKQKDKLTVLEYTMMKYVTEGMKDKKIMLDMIDRHISKAPSQMELSWIDWGNIWVDITNKQKTAIDSLKKMFISK